MNRHGIRHSLEHRLLPRWFFEDTQKCVTQLVSDDSLLFRLTDWFFQQEHLENPYSEDHSWILFGECTLEDGHDFDKCRDLYQKGLYDLKLPDESRRGTPLTREQVIKMFRQPLCRNS